MSVFTTMRPSPPDLYRERLAEEHRGQITVTTGSGRLSALVCCWMTACSSSLGGWPSSVTEIGLNRMTARIAVSSNKLDQTSYGRSQTMTIRRRRPGPFFIAATLLTAALPTAAAAVSSAHASSSPRSLPTWAHGSITGAGPHNGVRLELVVWPKSKIRVGQKVHLQVVGKATSTSAGSYAIHPSVALPKGIHNLEVLARSRVAVGAFSFPRKVAQGGRALVVAVDGSASARPVTANIHMIALPKSEQSAAPRSGGGPLCDPVTVKIKEFGPQWVDVGGLYSLAVDGKMQETYSAGSNTTLGVGISVGIGVASFSAGGTFTKTSTTTEPFPAVVGEIVNEQTPYTYGEYGLCGMHQVQPEVWVEGNRKVNVTSPLIDKCSAPFPPGQTITRKSGTAGTFKAGVGLKKVIGINLSAQSGYNKNVSIKYTFPSGGFLCGSNNYPSVSAWDIMSPVSSATPPVGRTSRSR
jgi:hypothetical protein